MSFSSLVFSFILVEPILWMFLQGKWSAESVCGRQLQLSLAFSFSSSVDWDPSVLDPAYMPPQRCAARLICLHWRCPSRQISWHQPHSYRPQKGGFHAREGGIMFGGLLCVSYLGQLLILEVTGTTQQHLTSDFWANE